MSVGIERKFGGVGSRNEVRSRAKRDSLASGSLGRLCGHTYGELCVVGNVHHIVHHNFAHLLLYVELLFKVVGHANAGIALHVARHDDACLVVVAQSVGGQSQARCVLLFAALNGRFGVEQLNLSVGNEHLGVGRLTFDVDVVGSERGGVHILRELQFHAVLVGSCAHHLGL